MSQTIILLRHFESQKNIEDRHGGVGNVLTPLGILQGNKIVEYLNKNYSTGTGSFTVYGHNVIQVKASVEILSGGLGCTAIWDERLRGINLGYLSGLSREEAANKYPGAAHRLELWRQGKLRADELKLPGGEDFFSFERRIRSLLNSWLQHQEDTVIAVCSRSTLIMLVNITQLGKKFDYSIYRVFDFSPASITEILIGPDGNIKTGKINYTFSIE